MRGNEHADSETSRSLCRRGGWAWPPAARSWAHSQAEDAGPQFVLEPGRLQHVSDELQLNTNTHKHTTRLCVRFFLQSHFLFFPFIHFPEARVAPCCVTSDLSALRSSVGGIQEDATSCSSRRSSDSNKHVNRLFSFSFFFFPFLDTFRLSGNNRKWTCLHHILRNSGRASTCSTADLCRPRGANFN